MGPSPLTFLQGGGEMGARMRDLDWSKTPLGPVDDVAAEPAQHREHAAAVEGADRPVLGPGIRRPLQRRLPSGLRREASASALGLPGREAWSEIWDSVLHELLAGVVRTGEAFWAQGPAVRARAPRISRKRPTSTCPTIPVRVESGEVGGVYCIVTETTERVVGERRHGVVEGSRRAQCHRAHRSRRLRARHGDARRQAAGHPVRAHVSG